MPGVHSFVNHADIPGMNTVDGNQVTEPLFAINRSEYAGQAVGLILADTFEHAREAAKAVVISYSNQQPPVLYVRDAIDARNQMKHIIKETPTKVGKKTNSKYLRKVIQ